MDAVKFLEERRRMCIEHYGCGDCPANIHNIGCEVYGSKIDVKEAVRIVEQWSEEHPVMTNADKLKEVFGIERGAEINSITLTDDWFKAEYITPEGD